MSVKLTFDLRPDVKLGFHISKEKTLEKSFNDMLHTPLKSYQIYICNARAFNPPKTTTDDMKKTLHTLERHKKYACVHGNLLYNLCGSVTHREDSNFQKKLETTCAGVTAELDIAAGFGSGVVVHFGTCKDKKKGIFTMGKAIEGVLKNNSPTTKTIAKDLSKDLAEFKKSRKLILENSAGEGSKLGSNLQEIAEIINSVDEGVRDQIKVCIDTAHIFGAGQYDFGSKKSVVKFFEDFDSIVGKERLELFHLNDSRVAWGSKKDRHENIGLGYIFGDRGGEDPGEGMDGLKKLIEIAEERKVPLIGEPPAKTKEGDIAPGGIWDYTVINELCKLKEDHFYC